MLRVNGARLERAGVSWAAQPLALGRLTDDTRDRRLRVACSTTEGCCYRSRARRQRSARDAPGTHTSLAGGEPQATGGRCPRVSSEGLSFLEASRVGTAVVPSASLSFFQLFLSDADEFDR